MHIKFSVMMMIIFSAYFAEFSAPKSGFSPETMDLLKCNT